MANWFKKYFGRGSKIDRLIRALPNPDEIRDKLEAWRDAVALNLERLRSAGDQLQGWSSNDSVLLDAVRSGADVLDGAGGLLGATGAEKREALTAQLRKTAAVIGIADQAFDAWWEHIGRPVLDLYIAKLRKEV